MAGGDEIQIGDRRWQEPIQKRTQTVEPVFGIIKRAMGFLRFHLRSLGNVANGWRLIALGYNFRRLARLQAAVGHELKCPPYLAHDMFARGCVLPQFSGSVEAAFSRPGLKLPWLPAEPESKMALGHRRGRREASLTLASRYP
jgi:hypothetical protein